MSKPTGLAKHFEGWQAAAVVIFMSWIAVLVLVPRTVVPEELPLPRLSPGDIAESRTRAAREEHDAFRRAPPSHDVRLLAARLQAYGIAERAGDLRAMSDSERLAREAAARVLSSDPAALLELRSHLAGRLVVGLYSLLDTNEETDDLIAVGGDVALSFARNGWLIPELRSESDEGREFDLALRALYKRRFGKIVAPVEKLPLDRAEETALVRFLLRHPPPAVGPSGEVVEAQFLLGQVAKAAELDGAYPIGFARGVVLFRAGRFEAAAASFDAFLGEAPHGPYRLRATNHLKAALDYAQGAP